MSVAIYCNLGNKKGQASIEQFAQPRSQFSALFGIAVSCGLAARARIGTGPVILEILRTAQNCSKA
jgi:hypothetical protein